VRVSKRSGFQLFPVSHFFGAPLAPLLSCLRFERLLTRAALFWPFHRSGSSFLLSAFRFQLFLLVPPAFLQTHAKSPDIPLHSSKRSKIFRDFRLLMVSGRQNR